MKLCCHQFILLVETMGNTYMLVISYHNIQIKKLTILTIVCKVITLRNKCKNFFG